MDLRDYLHTLTKRWKPILVCTGLALAAAITVTMMATPMYLARAQLFVSADPGSADTGQLNQGNLFTQQRVKSYARLVTSPLVLQPVIDGLGLKTTPEGLAGQISASPPLDTVLIDVSVRDASATQAALIANAVSEQFTRVVGTLERPESGAASPVKVSLVGPARVPSSPVSPNVMLNLGLGTLAGLSLGVGLALLLETLDTSVKRAEDLEELGAPALLGAIVKDSAAQGSAVLLNADPHGLRAEAYRQLRTNLQFVDVDEPPRCIVVTSAVPAEGKTTTTCNLAIALAEAGHRVVLVEGDLRRRRVGAYLGLESAAGLTSVLVGQASLDDVLQPVGDGHLNVLTSGPTPPNPSELLGSQLMTDLVAQLRDRAEFVVIDAPPLLPVTDAAVLSKLADGSILIVRAGHTRREQVARALDLLRAVNGRVLGTVLNMVPAKGRDAYSYGYYYDYRPTEATRSTRGASERAAMGARIGQELIGARGRR